MARQRGYISREQVRAHGDWEGGKRPTGQLVVERQDLPTMAPRGAWLNRSRFLDCGLDRLNFSGASLRGAELVDCSITQACLDRAFLKGARLTGCDLSRTAGRMLELDEADVRGCRFEGASLGQSMWYGARVSDSDFSGADLSGAKWNGAELSGCVLRGVRLAEATVVGTRFVACDFTGAQFAGAVLDGVAEVRGCVGWPGDAWADEMHRCLRRVPEHPTGLCRDAVREMQLDLLRAAHVAEIAGVPSSAIKERIRRYRDAEPKGLEVAPAGFAFPKTPEVQPPTPEENLWHCIGSTRVSIESCFRLGARTADAMDAFEKERDVRAELVADLSGAPGDQRVREVLVHQSFPCKRWVLLLVLEGREGAIQGHRILEDETGYRQFRVSQYQAARER